HLHRKRRAQRRERSMYALARGALGAPEDARDLVYGQVQLVVERQGEQVPAVQVVQRRVEVDPITPSRIAVSRSIGERNLAGQQHAPPPRAANGPALVRDDREEPRLEVGAVADAVELAPRLERSLLNRVLGR